jgi:hypothetical protein
VLDDLRARLVEAGRDTMGRNDGWRWWHERHLARLLDVWEPMIRADERTALAQKYGNGYLNLFRYCQCAQGGTYPGCPVHAEDWEQWIRADERANGGS